MVAALSCTAARKRLYWDTMPFLRQAIAFDLLADLLLAGLLLRVRAR
jgi:hypothetical protein